MSTPPPTVTPVRSRVKRADTGLLCEVRQGTGPWRMLSLDDLSQGGFSIARFGVADPTQPLRIRIPGLQVLSARVVWQKKGAIGCAFEAPLYEAVFEHIINSAK